MLTILSLFDYSGNWCAPYVRSSGRHHSHPDATDYQVFQIDVGLPLGMHQDPNYPNLYRIGADLLTMNLDFLKTIPIHGVLAAPPCTIFTRASSRHWKSYDQTGRTAEEVALFRKTLKICKLARGWWALENPPGRHFTLMPELEQPSWQFHPWHYGDPVHKQTYIWGTAKCPPATHIATPTPTKRIPSGSTQGTISRMSSSWKRQRAETPKGFAQEFFKANP